MPSYGPQNPTVGADDATIGTIAWATPGNVLASDNARVTATLSGTAITHYLKATGFNFSAIPGGETLTQLVFSVERRASAGATGNGRDSAVRIIKADGTFGTANKADTTTNWPATDAAVTYTFDIPTDESLTVADIQDSDFGLAFAATGSIAGTDRIAGIDVVTCTATTSTGAGGGPGPHYTRRANALTGGMIGMGF